MRIRAYEGLNLGEVDLEGFESLDFGEDLRLPNALIVAILKLIEK